MRNLASNYLFKIKRYDDQKKTIKGRKILVRIARKKKPGEEPGANLKEVEISIMIRVKFS